MKTLLSLLLLSLALLIADESHNSGQNCLNCHYDGGSANEHIFNMAGTIYTDPEGTEIQPNVNVYIEDANANLYLLVSSWVHGNIWFEEDEYEVECNDVPMELCIELGQCEWEYDDGECEDAEGVPVQTPVPPFTATVEYNGYTATMSESVQSGSCNSCHVAGMRIYVPMNESEEVSISYNSEWNLVGLPLEVEDASYNILFPESTEGTLYSFDETYILGSTLDQGEGYWLRFDNSGSATIAGTPINELTISLSEDWNLVSGISFPVDVNAVYDPIQLIIPGTVYGYGFSYTTAETIEPGYGYWLRSVGEGEVFLSSGPSLVDQTISDCEFQYPDPSLNLVVNGNTMALTMIHPEMNCCLEPVWDGWLDGNVFHITMTDVGDPCDCVCSFELSASYAPFPPGIFTLDFWPELFGNPVFIIPGGESGKGFSIPPQLASVNSMTFNGQTLYFGLEIPEEEQLSYSLPPKPPSGAFDARFKGDWRAVKDYGEVEVMPTSETLTISYDIQVEPGEHYYWVLTSENKEEYVMQGSGELTVPSAERFILNRKSVIPVTFTLHQNFPNPFNPITTLRYDLPSEAFVTISIYDMLGREVIELVSIAQQAGFKSIKWDATDSFGKPVSAGVYLYQIQAGEFVQTKKMVLLK